MSRSGSLPDRRQWPHDRARVAATRSDNHETLSIPADHHLGTQDVPTRLVALRRADAFNLRTIVTFAGDDQRQLALMGIWSQIRLRPRDGDAQQHRRRYRYQVK